jgi:energy-coupling factor transporter ATP-binding protein EcfA2
VLWLEAHLQQYPHTVIIVSHDRGFLNEVCTDTIEFKNKKLTCTFAPPTLWKGITLSLLPCLIFSKSDCCLKSFHRLPREFRHICQIERRKNEKCHAGIPSLPEQERAYDGVYRQVPGKCKAGDYGEWHATIVEIHHDLPKLKAPFSVTSS